MNICDPCEQFESRVKQWNHTHGVTDPFPYVNEMFKNHKRLLFEERSVNQAGCSTLLFRCIKCGQCWELFSWGAVGQLDIKPHFTKYHSST